MGKKKKHKWIKPTITVAFIYAIFRIVEWFFLNINRNLEWKITILFTAVVSYILFDFYSNSSINIEWKGKKYKIGEGENGK